MMISIELRDRGASPAPDELEIYVDPKGLEVLLFQLKLLAEGKTDHVHLMSEEWGGTHLSGNATTTGNTPVHHMKIALKTL